LPGRVRRSFCLAVWIPSRALPHLWCPDFREVAVHGRPMTTLSGGFLLPESPRWHGGALWFVDMLLGQINRLANGVVETIANFEHPTSLGFRPNGDLLVVVGNEVHHASKEQQARLYTLRGGEVVESRDLSGLSHRLNDMAVDWQGRAYIGDAGVDPFTEGWKPVGRVLLVEPDGEARVVAENILAPNGIAISGDGGTLVVGESMGAGGQPTGATLLGFSIAEDGSLSERRVMATLGRGCWDGLCFDSEGAVWVGTAFGHEVQRFLGAELVDRIPLPDRKWALACALGGPQLKTMFICTVPPPPKGDPSVFSDGWIERVEIDVPGVAPW
jgi:sugar lactone lactonase YvrE